MKLLELVDSRPDSSTDVLTETHTIGEDEANWIFPVQWPSTNFAISVTPVGSTTAYTEVTVAPSTAGSEYNVAYSSTESRAGGIQFAATDANTEVTLSYRGAGSKPFATRDINRLVRAVGPYNIDVPAPASSTNFHENLYLQTSLSTGWSVAQGTASTAMSLKAAGGETYQLVTDLGLAVQVENGDTVSLGIAHTIADGEGVVCAADLAMNFDSATAVVASNELAAGMSVSSSSTFWSGGQYAVTYLECDADDPTLQMGGSAGGNYEMPTYMGWQPVYFAIYRSGGSFVGMCSNTGRVFHTFGSNAVASQTHVHLFAVGAAAMGNPTPIQLFRWVRHWDGNFPIIFK